MEQRALLAAGDLDPSFGTDGFVKTDLAGGSYDYAYDVVELLPEGKILVAGSTGLTGASSIALARYLADGSLDPTFAGRGKTAVTLAGGWDVAIDEQGRIIVAGYSYVGSYADFANGPRPIHSTPAAAISTGALPIRWAAASSN